MVDIGWLLSAQIGSLQMKILSEGKSIEQKTAELMQEWEKLKPVEVCSWTVCVCRLCGKVRKLDY